MVDTIIYVVSNHYIVNIDHNPL